MTRTSLSVPQCREPMNLVNLTKCAAGCYSGVITVINHIELKQSRFDCPTRALH